MPVTIDEARRAKQKARSLAGAEAVVVGVGLTSRDGGYAVKVNLREASRHPLPNSVDGVPILYEVVGPIRAR